MRRVRTSKIGRLATISIENPPMNLLDEHLLNDLYSAASQAERSPDVAALVISGGSGAYFSAGIAWDSVKNSESFVRKSQTLSSLILSFPKPVIAFVNGSALGAGLELALLADFRLAREGCSHGVPETRYGYPSVFGGPLILEQLVGVTAARRVFVLGEMFSSADAVTVGLMDAVVSEAAMGQELLGWVQRVTNNSDLTQLLRQVSVGPDILRHSYELEHNALRKMATKTDYLRSLSELARFRESVRGGASNLEPSRV